MVVQLGDMAVFAPCVNLFESAALRGIHCPPHVQFLKVLSLTLVLQTSCGAWTAIGLDQTLMPIRRDAPQLQTVGLTRHHDIAEC